MRFLGALGHDVGAGVRTLRKSPRVALLAILCLSVGIGINATVFIMVNGICCSGRCRPGCRIGSRW